MSALRRLITFILLSALFPTMTQADVPLEELFIPLTQKEAQDIADKYGYELEKLLYFSKKHQLVRINARLLVSGKNTFTITPFGEEQLTVMTKNRKKSAGSQQIDRWEGEIIDPMVEYDEQELKATGIDAAHFRSLVSNISINIGHYVVDPDTAKINYNPSTHSVRSIGPRPQLKSNVHSQSDEKKQIPVMVFLGRFHSTLYIEEYHIKHIPYVPEIHVVYLEDRQKVLPPHTPDERFDRYQVFLQDLKRNRGHPPITPPNW